MRRAVFALLFASLSLSAQDDPFALAVEALENDDFAAAAPLLEKVLEEAPDQPDLRFHLAFAYTQLGRDEEAVAEYRKTLEAKPDLAEARSNLGLVLLRSGKPAGAAEQFEELAKLRPQEPLVHFYLGHALAAAERPEDAIPALERAAGLDPSSTQILVELGRASAAAGRFEEAAESYRKAAGLDPGLASLQLELGELVEQSGGHGLALEIYQGYLADHPGEPAVAERVAMLLLEAKNYAEAIPLLESVVEQSPTAANRAALAQAHSLNDDREKSLASWARAVQEAPNDADLRLEYAAALLAVQSYEQAAGEYLEAVKLDGSQVRAWSGLGFSLYQAGNLTGALKALGEAEKRGPTRPANLFLRAIIQDKLEMYQEAKASYESFLAAQPERMDDEVWKARQRLKTVNLILSKR